MPSPALDEALRPGMVRHIGRTNLLKQHLHRRLVSELGWRKLRRILHLGGLLVSVELHAHTSHQRWMTTRADRGAKAPVRWLNSTGSVVPTPQHVALSLQLQYPFGTHGYIALRCLFDPDQLLTQLVTQTYPCEKGVHHQYGCLSRWIVTTDLPSEADRGVDLQPSDLHAPDLLGRCRHTLGRTLRWLDSGNNSVGVC